MKSGIVNMRKKRTDLPEIGGKPMKKCVMISDSFKGTLSSQDICRIAEENLKDFFPDCTLIKVPVADGGEGTVACFYEACGGELVCVPVHGPYGEPVEAAYLRLGSGEAVIEMAAAAGLPQVGDRKNPCKTSTYGVGQLIRHAVEHGARRILLGLGGSCTNDGGCGCAAALGIRFYDDSGNLFVPVGETLSQIARIDLQEAERLLQDVRITVMCDIENPMHGKNGAAHVFAPQKGADPEMVEFLDGQLRYLDQAIQKHLGKDVSAVPGAGAAGGFGAGMMAFFDAELKPGIETVLDLVRFEELLQGCDVVFTGEGRLDSQSVQGKTISGIGKRAYQCGVPVVAVVGGVAEEVEHICDHPEYGVAAVFSINRQAAYFSVAQHKSYENYTYTFRNILRLIQLSKKM